MAKAYMKNELRGGSFAAQSQSEPPHPSAPSPVTSQSQQQYQHQQPPPHHHHHHHQQQQQQFHNLSKTNNNEIAGGPISHDPSSLSPPICYVCGSRYGMYELIRAHANLDSPKEPYFPFLERHEAPNGVQPLTSSDHYVRACMLCYRSLTEQWDAYEREGRPHQQRLYHMKRMDGKGYIGADMNTQGEYAAQMLGLSAEHLTNSGGAAHLPSSVFSYAAPIPRPVSREYQQQQIRNESPHRPTSRNESPHGKPLDYYGKNPGSNQMSVSRPSSRNNEKSQSRPQSRENPHNVAQQQQSQQLSQVPGRLMNSYDGICIKPSPFAQHKLKLGSGSYMTSMSSNPSAPEGHPQYVANSSKHSPYPPGGGMPLAPSHGGSIVMGSVSHVVPVMEEDGVLDLRNSHHSSASPSPHLHQTQMKMQQSRPPSNPTTTTNSVEVGILDLSMPDKNSTTEVCYVCGDEQRRGSLIEMCTAAPKDAKDWDKPFFPLFGETHPRPPRSRPIDPRGMIQACHLCHDYLMQQWNKFQVRLLSTTNQRL